jgi:hypothetical protein
VITYGTVIWLDPTKPNGGVVAQKISKLQNQGLRIVTGVYRATPVREIEKEVFVPPIELYCKELYAKYIRRTYTSPVGQFIKEQCRIIERRIVRRTRITCWQDQLGKHKGAGTRRIGLRRFLASARVPRIESGECLCGQGLETAEYILLVCTDQHLVYWEPGARFEKLVSEAESGAVVARQLIRSGKLGQYSLAV